MDDRQQVHRAIDQGLSRLEFTPAKQREVLSRLEGEVIVKKKISFAVAMVFVMIAVCLIGVAAAVIHGTALDDFLNANLKERGVAITNQIAMTGDMDMVDVKVKEFASDGIAMYLTVEYSLRDTEDSAIVFGRDMEYVMEPIRARETLPNHLSIPAAKAAKTLYWLTTDRFTCKDIQGVERASWQTFCLYESQTTVVVMYWFDLRADGASWSFIDPVEVKFPDTLNVSIDPKLFVYEGNGETAILTEEEPNSYVSQDDFKQVDAGELQITVSPKKDAVQKKYQIANFPEQVGQLRTVRATVTETPLLYCVRLDFQWMDGRPLPKYMLDTELRDSMGEQMEYLYLRQDSSREANGPGDVDFRLEGIYPKQDGRVPGTIELMPEYDEEKLLKVKWELTPME